MPQTTLDTLQQNYLRYVVEEGPAFEGRFGKNARRFFDQLPAVFNVLRRLSLDLEIPLEQRRLAAAATLYLAEPDDFLRETSTSAVAGAIDDVWVAFEALRRLRAATSDAAMSRHVRPPARFEDLADLAENVDTIKEHVPSRVLEMVQDYLG